MVARLDFCSVSLAQKPKSAKKVRTVSFGSPGPQLIKRTNLHVTMRIQENVVRFDVSVDNILSM